MKFWALSFETCVFLTFFASVLDKEQNDEQEADRRINVKKPFNYESYFKQYSNIEN